MFLCGPVARCLTIETDEASEAPAARVLQAAELVVDIEFEAISRLDFTVWKDHSRFFDRRQVRPVVKEAEVIQWVQAGRPQLGKLYENLFLLPWTAEKH